MRLLLILPLLFYLFPAHAQEKVQHNHVYVRSFLIAKNNRHARRYYEGTPLKIYYRDSGEIIKATGRLHIYGIDEIQLISRRGKVIHTINTGSISSIRLWKGPALVEISVLAGIGGLFVTAAYSMPEVMGKANLAALSLIIFAALDGYFIAADLPVVFIIAGSVYDHRRKAITIM